MTLSSIKNWEEMVNQVVNGDCLEVMKLLPDKSIDLVLTDPPYGISADKGIGGYGSSKTDKHYEDNWDNQRPNKKIFDEILRVSKNAIIFGGSFFTDILPVGNHWIVWDKTGGIKFQNPFSDCELAWTNINKKIIKKYIVIQQGFIAEERERFHPTQKPISLMEKIIMDYSKDDDLILDPFAGGGSTLVACKNSGRNFIGIEISPKYCDIAEARIKSLPQPLPF